MRLIWRVPRGQCHVMIPGIGSSARANGPAIKALQAVVVGGKERMPRMLRFKIFSRVRRLGLGFLRE